MVHMIKTTILVAALLLIGASLAQATKGTQNVANTVHNLSTTAPLAMYQTDSEEVCVFCHTPHGGRLVGPLWNRNDPTPASWQFYTSTTLTAEVAGVASVNDESLLCLSCHDGSIATNRVINPNNGLVGVNAPQPTNQLSGDGYVINIAGVTFNRIGAGPTDPVNGTGDLRDDHPISFNYDLAEGDAQETGLQTSDYALTKGVRFFPIGAAAGSRRVECSSCHDPHVDYNTDTAYAPFLITTNAGSALCLACHNK